MFARAFVINLPFKTDRLGAFQSKVPALFGDVEVWPAVHGDSIRHPGWWNAGAGAWGCYRSHMQILEWCYQRDIESYVVFEDDAIFRDGIEEKLCAFMAELPNDWEQVYLGGQLIHDVPHPPKKVSDNVYIPWNVNRTHCFAVHRRGYANLYRHLNAMPFQDREHIDHHLGRLHESGSFKVYCPGQWLVGQDSGPSNISGNNNSATFYVDPEKLSDSNRVWHERPLPAIFLESSIETAIELERRGWHRGHWQNEHNLDRGVCAAISSPSVREGLGEWFKSVKPEAVREGKQCVCLYHPSLNWPCVSSLEFAKFHRIQADDVNEAERQLATLMESDAPSGRSSPRNLIYHIFPLRENDMWRWNVEQLIKRIDQFDGVRTIAVVTTESIDETLPFGDDSALHQVKGRTDALVDVQRAFDGVRVDNWLEFPNDPQLGEVVTFQKMLETLPRYDGRTFYGHAKGVTHAGGYNTKKWAEVMYEVCLDDPAFVDESLKGYAITGPFKRGRAINQEGWHYSGTFFWFRNKDVFARDWSAIDQNRMGVEFWPRRHFAEDEGGSLFGHHAGFLYDDTAWDSHIQPWLEDWRKRRRTA